MKNFLNMTCLITIMLGITTTFTSCGNDNEYTKASSNLRRIFKGKLPKSVDGLTIETNGKGQVVAFKSEEDKNDRGVERIMNVTLKYKDESANPSEWMTDVVVTAKLRSGKLFAVYNMDLNEKGFVRHCEVQRYSYNSDYIQERWRMDFTYNGDDQLETIREHETTTTFIYKDGDIVEEKWDSKASGNPIYYTSRDVPTPIENKGGILCVSLNDDALKYIYYAGLLGKGTRHLPVKAYDNYYLMQFLWKFDAEGYPLAVYEKGNLMHSFTW